VIPILVLIGFIAVGVLWQLRDHVRARVAVGAVTVVVLGAYLLNPGLLVLSPPVPSGQLVGWELGQDFGGLQFDPATAQSTTVIPMVVDHPGWANDPDWLGEPAIAYTPWSVTITMHARDDGPDDPRIGMYLSGMSTLVLLSEPLGGRQLYDGSRSPPHPRSPGDPNSTMSR
jgi:hypothetical protein